MGNRGFIIGKGSKLGIYLHWNGGRDSVEGFLEWARLRGLPGLGERYGFDQGVTPLAAVIANFFGNDGNSIAVEHVEDIRTYTAADDNGVYVVDGFEIVDRLHFDASEQREYELDEMLHSIDERQGKADQLGAEFIDAPSVPTLRLKKGDRVWVRGMYGDKAVYVKRTVLGVGALDRVVNGRRVDGLPYVDMFANGRAPQDNPNNYLIEEYTRLAERAVVGE